MNAEQLRERVPSAFATHPASIVSERYGFISTETIINGMLSRGYTIDYAQQGRVRKEVYKGYQKHMIRFSSPYQKHADYAHQAVYMSSHNATFSARFFVGVKVFACLNGCISGDEGLILPHYLENVDKFHEGIERLLVSYENVDQEIDRMKSTPMEDFKQLEFTQLALGLRWDEDRIAKMHVNNLGMIFSPSKGNFAKKTVWDTFNNVQENMLRGVRKSFRAVTGIEQNAKLNRNLWKLALSYTI